MAKRYHHSKSKKRMRHDEHMGMERYERGPVKHGKGPHSGILHDLAAHEFYAGAANRHRQEFEDSEMIYEDDRAIANLPQEVMMKYYPMVGNYMPAGLDDGISGIDRQMSMDNRQRMNHLRPRKN